MGNALLDFQVSNLSDSLISYINFKARCLIDRHKDALKWKSYCDAYKRFDSEIEKSRVNVPLENTKPKLIHVQNIKEIGTNLKLPIAKNSHHHHDIVAKKTVVLQTDEIPVRSCRISKSLACKETAKDDLEQVKLFSVNLGKAISGSSETSNQHNPVIAKQGIRKNIKSNTSSYFNRRTRSTQTLNKNGKFPISVFQVKPDAELHFPSTLEQIEMIVKANLEREARLTLEFKKQVVEKQQKLKQLRNVLRKTEAFALQDRSAKQHETNVLIEEVESYNLEESTKMKSPVDELSVNYKINASTHIIPKGKQKPEGNFHIYEKLSDAILNEHVISVVEEIGGIANHISNICYQEEIEVL